MDPTQNSVFIAFAAIAPLLIAFVKQSGLSTQYNALIAFACYIVVGVAGALATGVPTTFAGLVPLIGTATVIGSAAYGLVWSKLGTDNGGLSLDARLTHVTSIKKKK